MVRVAEISIVGATIRLGQFLKLADAVEQGSDVKGLLAGESVMVNGAVETRRGRQLRSGDVIRVGPTSYAVSGGDAPGDGGVAQR